MHLNPALIGSSEDAYHKGKPIHIAPAARRRHCAIFGGSGAGKSTLLRNIVAVANAISIFKKLWADSWGVRMELILRNSVGALLEHPSPVSLIAILKLLIK